MLLLSPLWLTLDNIKDNDYHVILINEARYRLMIPIFRVTDANLVKFFGYDIQNRSNAAGTNVSNTVSRHNRQNKL